MAVATPCWPAPVSAITRVLPEATGKQRLAEGVVDLVGAGVGEVLALEVDGGGASGGRRGPAAAAAAGRAGGRRRRRAASASTAAASRSAR